MSEYYKGSDATRKMREINDNSRMERYASTSAFIASFQKKVRSLLEKDEEYFLWYDINLSNAHFCNFLDYIQMPCHLFDIRYKETLFNEYTTVEKESCFVGYSGSIDSSGNISISPVYDTVKVDVKNLDVYGDYDETKSSIISMFFIKGTTQEKFGTKIKALAEQYRYFEEESKHSLRLLKPKAELAFFFLFMSMLFSIGTIVVSFIEGIKWEHMTKFLIVLPVFFLAILFRILYVILATDVDKKKSVVGCGEGYVTLYFTIPIIALVVNLFGVAVGVPVFTYIAMAATGGMFIWNFITWIFMGEGTSLIYYAKESDAPRKAYIKAGGKEGYIKRIKELQKFIVPKAIKGFETPFFNRDLSKLRKKQSERYYRLGDF